MAVRAKVKIKVVETGQEYLLLVSKMNLKGILVNTSQMIKPNTPLELELKLNEFDPILLKGYVHKISEETANRKGMVIAFSGANDEAKKKIQKFINDSKETSSEVRAISEEESEEIKEKKKSRWILRKKDKEEKKEPKTEKKKPLEPNKTMIVGDEDLPSLSLSSPDNKSKISVATMDEESLHANNPGMSGSTRHVKLGKTNLKKKSEKKPFQLSTIYRAMVFVVMMIALVLGARPILKLMDKKFGTKIPIPSVPPVVTTNGATATAPTSTVTPSTGNSLDAVQVDDQGSFLKISLIGKGNFSNNKISKLPNPNRIHIDLVEISDIKATPTTNVSNNPLSKITVAKNGSASTVDLICTGVTAPNFEAKVYPNGMDIFIYR